MNQVCRSDNTKILFKIIYFSLIPENTIEGGNKLDDLLQQAENYSMHTKMIFCLKWERNFKLKNK